MYLKTIEIRGFKSFANKTELVFKRGVTAIVGPNGSGKSNISDAIRWVLGEQSIKSLRGGKMEDVIFSGTQFRKPVSLAQVSLTLDNTKGDLPIEYSDITISRRIYRSGESEYFINNTKCRLKDIHELFMDTGIGKEGYSIIGQGKIDAILSGKPEERRSLLEEAAGIVKFKTRKEEAEKKLHNTEENLVRINDILTTYEERLDPLREESIKAKQFLKYSDELKKKEINIAVHLIENIQNNINNVEIQIKKLNNKNYCLNENKIKMEEELDFLNEKLTTLENKISTERKDYYNKKEKQNQIISNINIFSERIKNFEEYIFKTSKDLDEIKVKLTTLKANKLSQEKELLVYKEQLKEINGFIAEQENKVILFNNSMEEKLNKIKKLKDNQIDYLSSISNTNNEISILNNNINTLKIKLKDVKSSCESYANSLKINSSTSEILKNEIRKLREKIQVYENKIRDDKKQILSITSLLERDEKNLKELNTIYNKSEANLNFIMSLEKKYEGYNKSVKNLMQDIDNKKIEKVYNNAFVLGEIITVKKELETSIEIALGGAISDIITENEIIAKLLIKYLKDRNMGRATFLPLNIIRGKKSFINEKAKNTHGYIGIASELIQYNPKFAAAIEYTLGRTIISNDMDSALIIAKLLNYSYKIVTIKGEVINVGGSLTGGSIFHSKNTSIIGRKREIEELKYKISDIKSQIDSINKRIYAHKTNIKLLDEECLNLKDEVYSENIEITKLTEKLSAIGEDSFKLKNKLYISNNEIKIVQNDIDISLKEIEERDKSLEKLQCFQKQNENDINNLEKSLESGKNNIQSIRDHLTKYKIKEAQIDEVVVSRLKDLDRLNKDIEELDNKIVEMGKSIKDWDVKKKSSLQNILENKNNNDGITEFLKKLEENFKENEIEIIKIKDQININKDKLEEISIVKNKQENELHRYEINLAKLEEQQKGLYDKLNDENELNYAQAIDYKEPISNIDTYKKSIEILKNNISSLGLVNVAAIEEYKEVKEKFNFMNGQKEDLIKAKDELSNVIWEMTDKMKVVFKENFNKLRQLFNETFKELFKGGNADLRLSSGDELSGNIDIAVQPAGKKLQNINLMSGGEKVLSAIALLFSILKMKPTPFCILDEIEAALDDANVSRYAEFLKKFSTNIQFIVITHRKGTMEASNVLYGVTMEEKGVSKIVSVDLTK
ncbi:chromosome segregation protein SMC [Clostridium rectalis]|uniref:chromosome segregation protein SMC n=1 Tax=Clostridium rectalis TaxID=2040295 RepID=UPI000F6342CC|nr:chromosome segregation protein SMC [Clostridium rectalis]